jgi:hypothetical protein
MMKGYTAYAALVIAFWIVATVRGWDFGAEKRGFIPQDVRQSAGGYRSFNYWRGGK